MAGLVVLPGGGVAVGTRQRRRRGHPCRRLPTATMALGAEQVTRAPKNTRRESEDAYVYIETPETEIRSRPRSWRMG